MKLIVGFSPSSASDTLARALAPELSRLLGQPVDLERHVGGEGIAAARVLMASPADGQTLMIATLGSHALNPILVPDLPYNPLQDFSPIALLMRAPLVLGVAPDLGIDTVADLVARSREKSAALSYGCSARAGGPYLAAALFCAKAHVSPRAAVYTETQQLYADLIAGRIAFSFNNPMTMLPLIDAGKVTGLAVTGASRSALAPRLPTMIESGYPGFEVVNWLGVVGPAGMTPDRVASLNTAIRAALHGPELAAELTRSGIEIPDATADEFGAHIAREIERWTPILRTA